VTEETVTEALYIRVAGQQIRISSANPLKYAFGVGMYHLGRLPGSALYAQHVAPRHLRLEEVRVALPSVPPGLAGLRIGFMTDVHFEPDRPTTLLERGVELLNDAAPDLILLGGDYVNSSAKDFDRPQALLGRLRAPLGVFAVLGNHDYWAGADYIAARLESVGIAMLRNRAERLAAADGTPWWLIGVDSATRRHEDYEQAFACLPPRGFRLLLAHEPEQADAVAARGFRADLQLSGHSHGGQIVLPKFGPPLLPRMGRRYVRGLHEHPAVYTGRGIGAVPPYIRLNCPPEVTVLTLECAAGSDDACVVEEGSPATPRSE
jgi:predicted MPP superfamily phosphohydrolase